MSRIVKCSTQADLGAALRQKNADIWLIGSGEFIVTGSAQVTACGSAQVTAYDSAQVRASESAQVTAFGSAQVTASGSAQVRASDSAQVTASKFVAVTRHGTIAKVDGGVLIQIPAITTPAEWCEYWDVAVADGIATLYKGVGDDFKSPHGTDYAPGSLPSAPDWSAENACGNGLHFSPRPVLTHRYNDGATRYVACGVRLDEMVVIVDGQDTPDKVKAPRVVMPCVEVSIDGDPIPLREAVQS